MDMICEKWLEAVCATLIKSAERMTAPREREHDRPPSPPDRLPPRRGGRPSSQTVSAAGRPAGFARLAGARRDLLRSARALASAALLALALAATAEAQTETTLVSNVDKSPSMYSVNLLASQGFTTGSNPSGYTLTGVDVVSATGTAFTMELCETDTSGHPTSTCTELTPPSSFMAGTMSYTVPAGTTILLAQSTTYSVKTTLSDQPWHGFTTQDDEDTADGWSIANSLDYFDPGTTSWVPIVGGHARGVGRDAGLRGEPEPGVVGDGDGGLCDGRRQRDGGL